MKSKMSSEIQAQIYPHLLCCALILLFAFISGCYVVEFFTPEGPPSNQQLFDNYQSVELMTSNAADVLATINLPEYELLSQSRSVIASAGQKKKGQKQWMNTVAFDEDTMTAKRKYLVIVDERPKALFAQPWERLTLHCQLALDQEFLNEPYANENAFRTETLKQIANQFTNDMKEVSSDNEVVYTSQLLVNQALTTILQRLQDSPAEASLLSTIEGMTFEHISFDKGQVHMIIEGSIAKVELHMGSLLKPRLELEPELKEYQEENQQ
jgi:hypothetical protein